MVEFSSTAVESSGEIPGVSVETVEMQGQEQEQVTSQGKLSIKHGYWRQIRIKEQDYRTKGRKRLEYLFTCKESGNSWSSGRRWFK